MLCSCTKPDRHQVIADWAGVPVQYITSQTQLDGLGAKAWPADGPSLISTLAELCGCLIPGGVWELWEKVEDIDDYLDRH